MLAIIGNILLCILLGAWFAWASWMIWREHNSLIAKNAAERELCEHLTALCKNELILEYGDFHYE